MAKRNWMLRSKAGGLEVYRTAQTFELLGFVELESTNSDKWNEISEILRRDGYTNGEVTLAIGTNECFATTLSDWSSGRRANVDEESFYYALEEELPWSAEDLIADVIASKTMNDSHMAVAICRQRWEEVVKALQNAGVIVTSISPFSLLAVQEACQNESDCDYLILGSEHTEFVRIRHGSPTTWKIVPSQDSSSCAEYEFASLGKPPNDVQVAELTEEDPNDHLAELARMAGESVAQISSGRRKPWLQLSRGSLAVADAYRDYRASLNALLVCSIALLLLIAAGLIHRAYQTSNLTESIQSRQVAVYKELLPGKKPPVGIRSRLQSEARKLQGLSATGGDVESSNDPLATLAYVISHLPDQLRFRVVEFRVEGNDFFLEGEARSHGDADRIASSLNDSGYVLGPLTTQQLSTNGVSFRLDGSKQTNGVDE